MEDDDRIRDSLRRALHLEGFDVSTAADGMAALDMMTSHTPDAIILDVMMPYLDGLQVARRVGRPETPPRF